MVLPEEFCWTKFGTESGESAHSILTRKEAERTLNDSVFLWGIGTSIRPSLVSLLSRIDSDPTVVFTPMISPPAVHDVAPSGRRLWVEAEGIDGKKFEIPRHSFVVSRASDGPMRPYHYALVCQSDDPINGEPLGACFRSGDLVNLRSGSKIGPSQVTSVVRWADGSSGGSEYQVAFMARLVYPYLAKLTTSRDLTGDEPIDLTDGSRFADLASSQAGVDRGGQLRLPLAAGRARSLV